MSKTPRLSEAETIAASATPLSTIKLSIATKSTKEAKLQAVVVFVTEEMKTSWRATNGEIALPREFERIVPDQVYLTEAALADFNVTIELDIKYISFLLTSVSWIVCTRIIARFKRTVRVPTIQDRELDRATCAIDWYR